MVCNGEKYATQRQTEQGGREWREMTQTSSAAIPGD